MASGAAVSIVATRVFAPATIGNVGVGYDVLGAAVRPLHGDPLGDSAEVRAAPDDALELCGPFAHVLPADPANNLAMRALRLFRLSARRFGRAELPPVHITLHKGLPVGSGLGSSACSIVATLVALNESHGRPLGRATMLDLMGQLEGEVSGTPHLDNVAPAFLGGVQLLVDESPQRSFGVPPLPEWSWVLCHPGVAVATADARAVMPATFPAAQTIAYGRGIAAFVHASHVGDGALAAAVLRDPLAEPRRAHLLPHLAVARAGGEACGAIAVGISGSGPTVFAVAPSLEVADRVAEFFAQEVVANANGFVRVCEVDTTGARVEVVA